MANVRVGYRYDTNDYMLAGDMLYASDYQFSARGSYMLLFDINGRLLFRTPSGGNTPWVSGDATAGIMCIMQPDGNLAIYDTNNRVWASNTDGHPNSHLAIQDNGYLVIYDSNNRPLSPNPWSRPPPPRG